MAFAVTKQVAPQWHMIFLRGIGANWLVCLACFLGMSGRDYVSKLVGIWWPTFAFVSLGFDHVVANMFFIPTGIWQKAPGLSVGLYIWKGIIPAGLGNIIGGALFVGTFYFYLHLSSEAEVAIDGVYFVDMLHRKTVQSSATSEDIEEMEKGHVNATVAGESQGG